MYCRFFACLICLVLCRVSLPTLCAEGALDDAYRDYVEGIRAQAVKEKNQHLNQALHRYTSFEAVDSQNKEKGRLYYNIGNSYFQLGEYAWAILYYRKAQQLIPRDYKLKNNIAIAEAKLQVPPLQYRAFFSMRELWILWTLLGVSAFLFCSLHIWCQSKKIKYLAYSLLASWCLLFAFLVIKTYLSPVQAVVIDSSLLYRRPGTDQPLVDHRPVNAGTSLTITAGTPERDWVKVYTADRRLGYLPTHAIRLVE